MADDLNHGAGGQTPQRSMFGVPTLPVTGWYSELVELETGVVQRTAFDKDGPMTGDHGVPGFQWRSSLLTSVEGMQTHAGSSLDKAAALHALMIELSEAQDRLLFPLAREFMSRIKRAGELSPEQVERFNLEIHGYPPGFYRSELTTTVIRAPKRALEGS